MNNPPFRVASDEPQDDLLEELCAALAAEGDGKLGALRAKHAGHPRRFEEMLGVARLYQAG